MYTKYAPGYSNGKQERGWEQGEDEKREQVQDRYDPFGEETQGAQ